jgi:hypothetical protein
MNDTEAGGLTDLGDGQNVNDTEAGGLTGQLWWSNHHGTGAGGLIIPWWRSDRQGQFRPTENHFLLEKITPRISMIQV